MTTPPDSKAQFMRRCFDLARLGAGRVSPNPMVGAVLVHENRVIGEGFHAYYGGPHAEVNALRSVKPENRAFIPASTLYVSLEPCCIFGNTPPCTQLIIKEKIPKVVIASLDATPTVAGRGLAELRAAGIEVEEGVLAVEGAELSSIRNTFAGLNRPYVILKYAQSQDGFIGQTGKSVWLSSPLTKRLVHRWRMEADAILVGTTTAQTDDPQLTNRLYYGASPMRILLDRAGTLSPNLQVFQGDTPTLLVREELSELPAEQASIKQIRMDFDQHLLPHLLHVLAEQKVSSVLVEGGGFTLQRFIDQGLWDEARVVYTPTFLHRGIPAPTLEEKITWQRRRLGPDEIVVFKPAHSHTLNFV